LLEELEVLDRGQVRVRSRSHSRGAIAIATGTLEGLFLGIDIEFMADRPFDAIMSVYLGPAPASVTPADFYRCWTFGEAYFKAFQRRPSRSAIMQVLRHRQDGSLMALDDGTEVLTRRVRGVFQLSLVWCSRDFRKIVPVFVPPIQPGCEPHNS
jgi:hypothetical protein